MHTYIYSRVYGRMYNRNNIDVTMNLVKIYISSNVSLLKTFVFPYWINI